MSGVIQGLNRDELLALQRPRHDEKAIMERIREHLDHYDGYLAFSGGKDSLAVLDIALRVEPALPVVFFDSGLEYPENYTYIRSLCDLMGANLHVIQARHSALEILNASQAWRHNAASPRNLPELHDVLITEPARQAHAMFGPGELWGVRAQESRGRAALYGRALRDETTRCSRQTPCCDTDDPATQRQRHGGVIRRADGTLAFGPIWNWTHDQVWAHIHRRRLPPNPVYAKLRRLGAPEHALRLSHMLDGCGLEQGRAVWLRHGWPDIYHDLARILPRLREYA